MKPPHRSKMVIVRVGDVYAVRIKFSVSERPKGCSYCAGTGHRTYFAYGRLRHVYCNKNCMISHQLERLMETTDELPK